MATTTMVSPATSVSFSVFSTKTPEMLPIYFRKVVIIVFNFIKKNSNIYIYQFFFTNPCAMTSLMPS